MVSKYPISVFFLVCRIYLLSKLVFRRCRRQPEPSRVDQPLQVPMLEGEGDKDPEAIKNKEDMTKEAVEGAAESNA